MTAPERRLVSTVLWQRLDVPGIEHFRLSMEAGAAHLQGTVLVVHEGAPVRLDYVVTCSPGWETRVVTATVVAGDTTRGLELVADERRRWWAGGRELEGLAGSADVDVSLSPSTNTLPIRRLRLLDVPVGESCDVTAAWVRVPELRVEPLPQRYTRLADRRFRYESAAGAFRADLEVDALGLVVSYARVWRRVAVVPPAPGP